MPSSGYFQSRTSSGARGSNLKAPYSLGLKKLLFLCGGLLLAGLAEWKFPGQVVSPINLFFALAALILERRTVVLTFSDSEEKAVPLGFSCADSPYCAAVANSAAHPAASALFLLYAACLCLVGENAAPLFWCRLGSGLAALLLWAASHQWSELSHPALAVATVLGAHLSVWYWLCGRPLGSLRFGVRQQVETSVRQGLTGLQLALMLSAIAFVWAPLAALFILPLLLYHPDIIDGILNQYSRLDNQGVREELTTSWQQLGETQGKLKAQESAIQEAQARQALLDNLYQWIASQANALEAVSVLVQNVSKVCGAHNVLFLANNPGQSELVPLRYFGAHPERVNAAPILKLREPLVTQSYLQQRTIVETVPAAPHRYLPDDSQVCLLPLGQLGVLYLGGPQRISKPEVEALEKLITRLRPLLESGLARQQQEAQILAEVQRNQELAVRLRFMHELVGAMAQLGAQTSFELFETVLASMCRSLIPSDLLVRWHQGQPASSTQVNPERLQQILQQCPQRLGVLEDEQMVTTEPMARLMFLRLTPAENRQSDVYGAIFFGFRQPQSWHPAVAELGEILAEVVGNLLERLQLFEEVRHARQTLEERHAQLIHANRIAAVGQLAAGVAHELNSPLAAASLAIESVQSMQNEPLCEKLLQQAFEGVQRSKTIVSRLLGQSSKQKGSLDRLSLDAVCRDTVKFIKPQMAAKGLDIVEQYGNPKLVVVNQSELSQVIINLLNNAADALAGAGSITVRTQQKANLSLLEIIDRGQGIAPENLQRVMEPFFTTKPAGRGTGLGLSLSQALIQGWGGTIEIQSVVGQGTRVAVCLPSV